MYTLLKFVKEQTIDQGADRNIYVALIKKRGEAQPFRVLVENFLDESEALAQVHAWIDAREKEDLAMERQRGELGDEQRREEVLENLNKSLI